MFVYSLKCRNLKKKLILCAIAVVVVVGGFVISSKVGEGKSMVQVNETVKADCKAPDNDARLTFLKCFGWEIEEEPSEVVDVAIPKEFGDVYENYNEIQKMQGFDLTKYKGKQVKRYTYIIINYPDRPENVRANLLVYKDKIIGGDVCSLEAENGFMHGFAIAES